jgi:hypothetical protein
MSPSRSVVRAPRSRWSRAAEALAPLRDIDPIVVGASLALTLIGFVAVYSSKLVTLAAQGLPSTTSSTVSSSRAPSASC